MIRHVSRSTVAGVALLLAGVAQVSAHAAQAAPPDLAGVYQSVPGSTGLPGGLRNAGSPLEIDLLPAAAAAIKAADLEQDPARSCQPIGPFRMMASEGTKIEIVPALNRGMLVMLFEDVSHGQMRSIFLSRSHPDDLEPTWLGDSTGRWEGDTLVIDTVGFNQRNWLNDAGARHSEALRLVERIRPILGGSYLEYRVTADDPKSLVEPYTYVRYYRKLDTEIMDDVCEP